MRIIASHCGNWLSSSLVQRIHDIDLKQDIEEIRVTSHLNLLDDSSSDVVLIFIKAPDHHTEDDMFSDLLLDRLGDFQPERTVNFKALLKPEMDVLLSNHLGVKALALCLYKQELCQFGEVVLLGCKRKRHGDLLFRN